MEPVDPIALGRRIKARRTALGIKSTGALGKLVSAPQQSISGLENGKSKNSKWLHPLAGVLATTVEWLLWEKGPEVVGSDRIYTREQIADMIQRVDEDKRKVILRVLETLAGAA